MSEYTADSVSSTSPEIACSRCGVIDTPAVGQGSGPHTASARCRHCKTFLQWLSPRSPAERQARRQQARLEAMARRPPTAAQLAYLVRLGDQAKPPGSMLQASQRINALVRGEGQR